MFEKFTDRARKTLALANQAAQTHRHEYIGTEHILIGLCKEGGGIAVNALKKLGIKAEKLILDVSGLMKDGPDIVTMGKLPQTPRAKRCVELAIQAARDLNHSYVGTEHLLLGLLDEKDGLAAQVLASNGVTRENITEEILELIGAGTDEPTTPVLTKIWEIQHLSQRAATKSSTYIVADNMEIALAKAKQLNRSVTSISEFAEAYR